MKNLTPKPVKPPKNASKPAKSLWRALQTEYGITDAAGLDLLNDYVLFYDRREQARDTIRLEGATIKDRFGQTVAHPATRTERDASGSMMKILRALNLDLEPLKTIGRPPGK
jgi:P27 family predicted phage terminase small subunit